MVNYDESQVTYIYELFYPDSKYYRELGLAGKVFYIGKTIDVLRRAAQHEARLSPLLKQLLSNAYFDISNHVRLVPELPDGVPSLRADEFEGYFIIKRETLYDPSKPGRFYVGNQKHADHVAELTPERYEELTEEIEQGVTMELPQRWCEEIEKARAREQMYADLVNLFTEEDEDDSLPLKHHLNSVEEALTISRADRLKLEEAMMPIVELVELRQREYEAMPYYEPIIKEDFVRVINSIVDKVGNDVEDAGVRRMLKSTRLMAKPVSEGGSSFDFPASAAATFLKGIAQILEAREVSKMPKSTAVGYILRVRDWTFNNDMKQPSPAALTRSKPGTREEKQRGDDLHSWKQRHRGKDDVDDKHTDFLMRHVWWWPKFAHTTRAERGAIVAKKINKMLIAGFRYKDEPDFEGSVPFPCDKNNRTAYYKLEDTTTRGSCTEADLALMTAPPLNPERAKWIKDMYNANEHKGRENANRSTEKIRARREAITGNATKRKKTGESPGSGSSTDPMAIHDSNI